MAFSIESRVPFADDVELVDFIFSVDGKSKIKNGVSKYLLREATKNYIPKTIYTRTDKIGFETPVSKWFINHKNEVIEAITNSLSDIVNTNTINSHYEKLLNEKPTFIIRLYSFAIWKNVFSIL